MFVSLEDNWPVKVSLGSMSWQKPPKHKGPHGHEQIIILDDVMSKSIFSNSLKRLYAKSIYGMEK